MVIGNLSHFALLLISFFLVYLIGIRMACLYDRPMKCAILIFSQVEGQLLSKVSNA